VITCLPPPTRNRHTLTIHHCQPTCTARSRACRPGTQQRCRQSTTAPFGVRRAGQATGSTTTDRRRHLRQHLARGPARGAARLRDCASCHRMEPARFGGAASGCLEAWARVFGTEALAPIDYIEMDWAAEPFARGRTRVSLSTRTWCELGPALGADRMPRFGRVWWAASDPGQGLEWLP
jgi:monoamine oxidase